MDNEKEWRESLKAGDEVVIVSRFRDSEIRVVDRVTKTKTQIVIGLNKYRTSDGYIVGGDTFSFTRISKPTKEIINEIRRKNLFREISRKNLEYFSLEKLERIKSIIDEGKQ